MADKEKEAKLKALKLTLDKLDKTYGKGTVMKMGDQAIVDVEIIPSGSLGLDVALGDRVRRTGPNTQNIERRVIDFAVAITCVGMEEAVWRFKDTRRAGQSFLRENTGKQSTTSCKPRM